MTTYRGIQAKSLSGRGSFFTGCRCKTLVMISITAVFAPSPAKNSSRENHELNEFVP